MKYRGENVTEGYSEGHYIIFAEVKKKRLTYHVQGGMISNAESRCDTISDISGYGVAW